MRSLVAALLLLVSALGASACHLDPNSPNYAPMANQRPDPAQIGGGGAGAGSM